jgi:hypothetical protein
MNRFLRQFAKDNLDTSPSSNMNINELLLQNTSSTGSIETVPSYLEGQTIESIQRDVYVSLCENIPDHYETDTKAHIELVYTKLAGYRYVDEIYKLQRGKHIRWIRLYKNTLENNQYDIPKLTSGGIVVDIKIMDTGVHILCKTGSRYTQYKFDECLTYQKLSTDELLLFTAYDFATAI